MKIFSDTKGAIGYMHLEKARKISVWIRYTTLGLSGRMQDEPRNQAPAVQKFCSFFLSLARGMQGAVLCRIRT